MKKGQWVATQVIGMSDITLTCSNCKDEFIGENDIDTWKSVYRYCPSCGAYMGDNVGNTATPWKLVTETDRSLLYGYEEYRVKNWLFFDKEMCRCWGNYERFEVYDEATWCTMDFPNEFVKYSSKYGRWYSYDLIMDLDTIEFISDVLMKIKLERSEKSENTIN